PRIMKSDCRTSQFLPRTFLAAAIFALTSAQTFASDVSARYVTGAEVPVTADAFNAHDKTVNLVLNFAPAEGKNLMHVRNTGPGFIQGEFNNLAQGQIVALPYSGITYHFVSNYYGGAGRDLVLMPIRLNDLAATAREKL